MANSIFHRTRFSYRLFLVHVVTLGSSHILNLVAKSNYRMESRYYRVWKSKVYLNSKQIWIINSEFYPQTTKVAWQSWLVQSKTLQLKWYLYLRKAPMASCQRRRWFSVFCIKLLESIFLVREDLLYYLQWTHPSARAKNLDHLYTGMSLINHHQKTHQTNPMAP